jgi:hypothetical protein
MAATGLGQIIEPDDCGCGGAITAGLVAGLAETVAEHSQLLADQLVASMGAQVHSHTEGDVALRRLRLAEPRRG